MPVYQKDGLLLCGRGVVGTVVLKEVASQYRTNLFKKSGVKSLLLENLINICSVAM